MMRFHGQWGAVPKPPSARDQRTVPEMFSKLRKSEPAQGGAAASRTPYEGTLIAGLLATNTK